MRHILMVQNQDGIKLIKSLTAVCGHPCILWHTNFFTASVDTLFTFLASFLFVFDRRECDAGAGLFLYNLSMNKQLCIEGGCHCGNIRYRFYTELAPSQLSYRRCACSFCRKRGVVYTSDPQGRLEVNCNGDITVYQFASKDVEFISCPTCGILTHVLCASPARQYAVLNGNTFDAIPADRAIVQKDFTAEDPAQARQRRYQNWIPDVTSD